ncbi:carboxypeptidase-like regulatory domain-containing protein [Hymenobacter cellulosilyticus]|uniref:Carboxypeptidase-like regulatory domain-containing protein n=1 Tax=Hymenobacter cellulosilyticus TaxID=2932248 RepID=A0A8T9PYM3_9BACT|nr:carboxypeptidase-like regulatory domain-containing protein [Hymenobacter cellulosilyticus]UOQ70344.1 carboxypeptidase-like regulatory domain-containing protein [Hymenobacter cellulosilyticus]
MKYLLRSVCSFACVAFPFVVAAQSAPKTTPARPRPSTEQVAVAAPAPSTADVLKKPAVPAKNAVKVLTGFVLNEEGEPLAGATVMSEKGEIITTNSDGQFMIQSTAATPVLRVSYAGYQEMQMPINTLHPTTFRLDPIENYQKQLKKQSKAATKAWKH